MYCPNCGKTVPEGAVFCEYCGAVISGKNANASPKLTSEVIEQQSFDMSAMDMDSLRQLADAGDTNAMLELSDRIYDKDDYTKIEQANSWDVLAAENGSVAGVMRSITSSILLACINLLPNIEDWKGVQKYADQAVHWSDLALSKIELAEDELRIVQDAHRDGLYYSGLSYYWQGYYREAISKVAGMRETRAFILQGVCLYESGESSLLKDAYNYLSYVERDKDYIMKQKEAFEESILALAACSLSVYYKVGLDGVSQKDPARAVSLLSYVLNNLRDGRARTCIQKEIEKYPKNAGDSAVIQNINKQQNIPPDAGLLRKDLSNPIIQTETRKDSKYRKRRMGGLIAGIGGAVLLIVLIVVIVISGSNTKEKDDADARVGYSSADLGRKDSAADPSGEAGNLGADNNTSSGTVIGGDYYFETGDSEPELKSKLESATSECVWFWEYHDYNNDGTFEAFAVTSPDKEVPSQCTVWFISDESAIQMKTVDGLAGGATVFHVSGYFFFDYYGSWGGANVEGHESLFGVRNRGLGPEPFELIVSLHYSFEYDEESDTLYGYSDAWNENGHVYPKHRFKLDEASMEFIEVAD